MINMSDSSRNFLKKHLPDVLKKDNIDELLIDINDYMIDVGFDENWDITLFGREIEAVYDDIYYSNE